MAERRQVLRYALVDGEPISAGGVRVTPQARVLEVHWRGGGLVWNRPVAVAVERDGHTTRMPIVDATRLVQLVLGVCAGVCAFMGTARMARSVRRGHE